jgi:hypothetical protein
MARGAAKLGRQPKIARADGEDLSALLAECFGVKSNLHLSDPDQNPGNVRFISGSERRRADATFAFVRLSQREFSSLF